MECVNEVSTVDYIKRFNFSEIIHDKNLIPRACKFEKNIKTFINSDVSLGEKMYDPMNPVKVILLDSSTNGFKGIYEVSVLDSNFENPEEKEKYINIKYNRIGNYIKGETMVLNNKFIGETKVIYQVSRII